MSQTTRKVSKKYGIPHAYIRYVQREAKLLRRATGWKAHRSMADRYNANYRTMKSSEIARIAISLAEANYLGMIGFTY